MIFPQHVSHMWSSPNRVSAPRQIEQMSPSLLSSSSTARAGAAALSPSDIKLAGAFFLAILGRDGKCGGSCCCQC